MTKINRKQFLNYFLFILILCVARGLREIETERPLPTILGLTQTLLYVGLIAFWSISVRRRIVRPQIRVILEYTSGLMIFWHLARGIKYHIVAWYIGTGWVMRYLWYLYYIPLLFIPAFLIMIAFSLRKPESYRLPKKAITILLSISTALFLLVITNDLHQLIFNFPTDAVVYTDKEYTRGILYYLCFAWIIGGSLTFFIKALKSCRLPNKKLLWLPIALIIFCIFYSIIYILGNGVWFVSDFTTVFTFSLIAIFEVTILVGLVPSNNLHEELFSASDRSGFITDENLNVIYASKKAEATKKDVLQKVIEKGSVTEDGMRINFSRIIGGYIFWKDNIVKLLEANQKLEWTKEELCGYGLLLEEENKQKRRRQKLIERQVLYESIRKKTEPQQKLLSKMAEELQDTIDIEQAKILLHRITVIGAYIKRRSNLSLLIGKIDKIPVPEVELCIKESITYLKLSGITAATRFEPKGEMSLETAERLYDFFENVVELSLDTLKAITVFISSKKNEITLKIMTDCTTDMNILKATYPEVDIKNDNDTWFCSITVKGGVGV